LIGFSISELLYGVNSGTIPTCCMSFQRPQMLGFVLHGRSAEFRADLNNTAKRILEKGATQIRTRSVNSLPQVDGDSKPFAWGGAMSMIGLVHMSSWNESW